jgi:hypothetical protein
MQRHFLTQLMEQITDALQRRRFVGIDLALLRSWFASLGRLVCVGAITSRTQRSHRTGRRCSTARIR